MAIELVDELSSGELVGGSRVSLFETSMPDAPLSAASFISSGSRWVFENLAVTGEVVVRIHADNYFSELVTTGDPAAKTLAEPDGIEIPSLVTAPEETKFVQVRLRPHMGYPFAASLTRVVGSVLLNGAPIGGADVQVTPRYVPEGGGTSVPGTPVFRTLTDHQGQFVAWLYPNTAESVPVPVAFDVVATLGTQSESLTNQPLLSRTINGVTIRMVSQTRMLFATGGKRARSSRRKRCLNC